MKERTINFNGPLTFGQILAAYERLAEDEAKEARQLSLV